MIDKSPIPGLDLNTTEAKIQMNNFWKYLDELAEKNPEEYKKLVDSGKLRPKTAIERTIEKAHGNPENKATQAARRMAAKRGYDWKTGKKLK